MAARVVARVLFVAKRRASMRDEPSTVTQACKAALPSPSGHLPQSVQSPWLWMPGPVSKRINGSPIAAGRRIRSRRRRLAALAR